MGLHIIKYYENDVIVGEFMGDDETIANSSFQLNYHSFFPKNFFITKTNSEFREFVLKFVPGGYSWVEVRLNSPTKELNIQII